MEPARTRLRGKVVTDMSERAAMKRRVRGVLRHKWPEALAASVLALAPCAAAAALFALLVWPRVSGGQAVDLPSLGSMGGGVLDSLLMAAAMLGGGLSVNWRALGGAALWALIPLAVWALAALPMRVSVSGYYLALLRGKKTSALDVFSCFTERWPRYVGGMLLNALGLLLWAAMAVAAPVALYILAQPLLPKIQQALNLINSWYVWTGTLALCVAWFVVFTLVFINRAVAYGFTPICLAAHPRLPAKRAPRLSRKVARGCKWRVIGLYLSFIPWLLPSIACAAGAVLTAGGTRRALLIAAAACLLVFIWVGPYLAACRRAFYIERKREALMDEDVIPDDFGRKVKPEKVEKSAKAEEKAE